MEPATKRRPRFQSSGVVLGMTLSYPIDINVPSFSNVMSISIRTGI